MPQTDGSRVLTEKMYLEGVIPGPEAKALPGITYEATALTEDEAQAKSSAMWGRAASTFTPAEKSVVYVPGISDMIHVWPPAKPTKEELAAHKAAIKAGQPSPLSDRQKAYLKEKRERFKRMKQSPTPEIVKSFGTVMTWFDDFGDAMTTAAWGGKGAIWLATKIGLKVATRAIPYLGWVLLAKDIADTVNLFRTAGILGRAAKRAKWQSDGINPFGKKAKASRLVKLKTKIPGIPDIIEIAQTTDQLFGVGISFGPAVGLATDAIFGFLKGSAWRVSPELVQSSTVRKARGMQGGAMLGAYGQDFTAAEHCEANAAVGFWFDDQGYQAPGLMDYAVRNDLLNRAIAPPPVTDETTRFVLEEEGIDPDAIESWPFPGSPARLTPLEMMKHIQGVAPANLGHWLKPLSRDFRSLPAGEVVDIIVKTGLEKLVGEPLDWQETQTPQQRVYHRLMEGGVKWPEGTTEAGRIAYVEQMTKDEEAGVGILEQIKNADEAAASGG